MAVPSTSSTLRPALARRRTLLALAAAAPGTARAGRARRAEAGDLSPASRQETGGRAAVVFAPGQQPNLVALAEQLYVTSVHEGEVYTRAMLPETLTDGPAWRLTNTHGLVVAHGVASYGAGAYVALRARGGAVSVHKFDAAWQEIHRALLPAARPGPAPAEPDDAPLPGAGGLLVAYSPECLYVATPHAAAAPAAGAFFRHLDAGLRITHTWSADHAVDWVTASLSADGAALSVLAALPDPAPAGDDLVLLRFDARTGQETSLLERVPLLLATPATSAPPRYLPGNLTPTPGGHAVVYLIHPEPGSGGVYLNFLDQQWSAQTALCLALSAEAGAPARPVHPRVLHHGSATYVAYAAGGDVVLHEVPD